MLDLFEVGDKVDNVYANLGKKAIGENPLHLKTRDWLGLHTVGPQLDIPTLGETTTYYLPIPETPDTRHQHN